MIMKTKKDKSKRPSHDEFELEELGNQLEEAKAEEYEVVLAVWGRDEPVRGKITELDSRTRLVHVQGYDTLTKVPFLDIMKVASPGS